MDMIIKWGIGGLSIILLASCSPRLIRDAYFQHVTELATEEQVTLQLGPPNESKAKSDGGDEWRYRDYQPSGYPYRSAGYCTEYILQFDANKVLREWKRQECAKRLG